MLNYTLTLRIIKIKLMPDMYRCIFKTQQVKLGILTGKRILGSLGNSYCIQN